MIELLQIIFIFFIFCLSITVPINIFNSNLSINKKNFKLDIASFNLLINCNILLLLSIIPIALSSYNLFYLITCSFIFIYIYFIKNHQLKDFKKILIVISFFFIIFLIIAISVANELKLGWDAKYFYYIKALFFAEDQILYNIKRFAFGTWHPHLGSYYWAFYWSLMPLKLEYFGRLFYVFILIFSLFYVCHDSSKNNFRNNIIFSFLILIFYNYEIFSGLQEVLIFSFLAILSKYFFQVKYSENRYFVIFIILGCNLMMWIKVEGIVYSSILILLLNLSNFIPKKMKIYSTLSFFALFFFKIIIYQFFNEKTSFLVEVSGHPYYLEYIYNLNIDFIFYKLKFILPYLIFYTLNNVFFILGILLLLILNFKKDRTDYIKCINFYFILNLSFIICAYLFRDMEIEYSVRTTMDRVIFTSSGFFVFLVVNYVKKFEKDIEK
jgi:hypothetical protein